MSLKVWLPLNGKVKNQGLTNTKFQITGTEYYDGKMGKCIRFDGVDDRVSFEGAEYKLPISVCCWIKVNDTSKTDRYIYAINDGTQGAAGMLASIYITNVKQLSFMFFNKWMGLENFSLEQDKWYHITTTIDEEYNYSVYVNGELNFTWNLISYKTDFSTMFLTLGARSSAISGNKSTAGGFFGDSCINDFRVYDHCLSQKEISEIAKGLVCHYKLDNNGFNENILNQSAPYNTAFSSGIMGVTMNSTTGYWNWNGSIVDCPYAPCGKAARATISELHFETGGWGGGLVVRMNSSTQTTLQDGKVYTVSAYVRSNKNGMVVSMKQEQMTSNNYITLSTEWQKFTYTCAVNTSTKNHAVVFYLQDYKDYEIGDYIEVHSVKLELGSKATTWTPNVDDSLYSSLHYNNALVTDVSGFNNHGTKTENVTFATDSPRYDMSAEFNGTDTLITSGVPQTSLGTNWTISVWGYADSSVTKRMGLVGMHYAGLTGIGMPQIEASIKNTVVANGKTWGVGYYNDVEYDKWNHYVMAYDNGVTKFYLNGELSHEVTSVLSPADANVILGNTYTDRYWKGMASDFRIYATTLESTDIKELFSTSASLDKNGVLFGREMEEE